RATATIDVEVRKDPQQPGPQVRPRLVLLPGAERAGISLLHQVLGLLARADQPSRDAIDLVAELEGLFFEPDTVACDLRQSTGFSGRRCALAHPAATLATWSNDDLSALIPLSLAEAAAEQVCEQRFPRSALVVVH